MNYRAITRRNQKRRTGVTVVEFAIVAPVFFLVLFASIEFSRLNVIRNTADHAAYEAARTGLVPGATAAEAIAEANRLLNIVGARNATVVVTPSVLVDATPEITVTVTVPMAQNAFVLPRFFSGPMVGEATLKTERVVTVGST